MGKRPEGGHYREESLYDHMPVYHARLASVQALIADCEEVDLDAFHMHYDGIAPLERAAVFFAQSARSEPAKSESAGCEPAGAGVLLDLGCGYGSNVVWFAERGLQYGSLLGVDLIPEHIEIARHLARRRLGDDERTRFLAMDISALTPEQFARCAGQQQASSVIALNTFLHLTAEQRTATWRFLDRVLTEGGRVYVEDFFARRALTTEEHATMRRESGCAYLPPRTEYVDLIADALTGAHIGVQDISASYTAYAQGRHRSYTGDDPDKQRFYRTVFEMLDGGAVGGIRLEIVR